jgi:AcrR family transcriptional regulator
MAQRSAAREQLLDRCVEYLLRAGFNELSLRDLGTGVGTSHRMLIYHFGSRDGLLAAVVGRVEAEQRRVLAELVAREGDLAEISRAFWLTVSDPALAPAVRLFFEVYTHALRGRPWTEPFRASVIAAWEDPLSALLRRHGYPPADARHMARLGIATTRGLLLDLLLTDDRATVDAAADLLTNVILATRPAPVAEPSTAARGSEKR